MQDVPPNHYESLAFHHAPDATLLLAERKILRASLMVEQVFGWEISALEGQSIRMLYPDESDYARIGERARRAMLRASVYADERFMRLKSGQIVWMAARGRALDQAQPQKLAIWTYRPLAASAQPPLAKASTSGSSGLTPAEMRVAGHLVNGLTSKEIGKLLGSSPRTVEVHRANMIRKLNVRNSFELVRRLLAAHE